MTAKRGRELTLSRLRYLAVALLLGPFLFGVALYFVLDGLGSYPAPPLALALSTLVVVALALAESVGFRASRSPESVASDSRASVEVLQYQSAMSLRTAITEAPIIMAIAVCFVRDDPGLWPYIIAGVPAIAVMAFEIWPSRRNIDKFARALEANGQPSELRERLLGPR